MNEKKEAVEQPRKLTKTEERHIEALADPSRLGVVHIDARYFTERPDLVRHVLRELEFLPHMARPLQDPPVMEYMGHSPRFEPLGQGDQIPNYRVNLSAVNDGPPVVSLERQEERRIIVPGRERR